jgi:2,3-bisphosphoglycerate-independent phosphoglycerate mutase
VSLVRLAADRGLDRIAIHAFTDGRDTAPESGLGYVSQLEGELAGIGAGRISTISGRYYAMDRDHRWERTKRAFDAIVHGEGPTAPSAAAAIEHSYADGVTDEFIIPAVIPRPDGSLPEMADGDAVVSFNFRSDRMRQLIAALSRPDFDEFDRGAMPADLSIATMTRYEEDLPVAIIFPPKDVVNPLARVISEQGMMQFHAAETEKYPHVTFFLNGGREDPFTGEERGLVPSPKVATYDLQPEMSAPGVCDAVLHAIGSGRFDFVIVNFANCDMVGHTGVFGAAVKAVETVDQCLGLLLEAVLANGGRAIVTADHGNAEEMIDRETGGPMTAHTTNPVPVIFVTTEGDTLRHATLRNDGVLSAVAPTILGLLDVTPPPDMDQASLIVRE